MLYRECALASCAQSQTYISMSVLLNLLKSSSLGFCYIVLLLHNRGIKFMCCSLIFTQVAGVLFGLCCSDATMCFFTVIHMLQPCF